MITGAQRSKRPATEGSEVDRIVIARCTAAERNPVCEATAEHEAPDNHGVNPCHFSMMNFSKCASPLITTFF